MATVAERLRKLADLLESDLDPAGKHDARVELEACLELIGGAVSKTAPATEADEADDAVEPETAADDGTERTPDDEYKGDSPA